MIMTDKFIQTYGQLAYEQIFETFIGDKNWENVYISEKEELDVINCRFYGFIEIDDKEVWFKAEDGNWNGSVILDFDEDKDKTPAKKWVTFREFVVDESKIKDEEHRQVAEAVLNGWKKKNIHKINDMESSMNYDFFFEPTLKTRQHYQEYASKHGMRIGTTEKQVDRW
jgi:hypothetical protein